MSYSFKSKIQRGGVLAEFAIIAPVIITLVFGFWDVAVTAIMKQRQEVIAFLIATDYIEAPLKIETNNDGTVSVNVLDDTDSNAYMNRMIEDFRTIISDFGNGASFVTNNMMIELHYLSIHSAEETPPLGETRDAGYAYSESRAGTATYTGVSNTTDCFDNGDAALFSNYITTKLNRITGYNTTDDPPIGTKSYKIHWNGATSDIHLKKKPIIFIMMCSKPPRVFSTESIRTMRVLFPPKEVGFP